MFTICFPIKVDFFFLADTLPDFATPFFPKLMLDAIDLGAGKRVVVKGGKLNKTYNITVPRENPEETVGF